MSIINRLRAELSKNIDNKYKIGCQNYFKEGIKCYGVRTPIVRRIAIDYFPDNLSKQGIFALCDELLMSGYNEESCIAFSWTYKLRKKYESKDFLLFESWLSKYVDNWGKCDDFCNHSMWELMKRFPEHLPKLKLWAKSKNRWMRRAAAVTLVVPARNGLHYDLVFEIADILLTDSDDLVQKGYGWMLKEASNNNQKRVFDYVMKNKAVMPRTALRYAIEKMPEEMRQRAMGKWDLRLVK